MLREIMQHPGATRMKMPEMNLAGRRNSLQHAQAAHSQGRASRRPSLTSPIRRKQPPKPPTPKPEEQKAQAEMQMAQQKMQAEMGMKQADMNARQQQSQAEAVMQQQKSRQDAAAAAAEVDLRTRHCSGRNSSWRRTCSVQQHAAGIGTEAGATGGRTGAEAGAADRRAGPQARAWPGDGKDSQWRHVSGGDGGEPADGRRRIRPAPGHGARLHSAQTLLENTIVKEAFDTLEAAYIEAWKATG